MEPPGIAEAIGKARDDMHARISSDLATVVATKTQLDRAVLAAHLAAAARLEVARGKADADIRHFAILSSLLVSTPSAAVGPVPAMVADPSSNSHAMIPALQSSIEVVAERPSEVPSGQTVSASACSSAADNPRQSPAIASCAAWVDP
jgi:hypothetical protein